MSAPLRYIDSCASIGMHGPTDARVPWKVASLLDDMEHAAIHGALVWHWLAREYAPTYGSATGARSETEPPR